MNEPPLYIGSVEDAKQAGEISQWRDSFWANVDCRDRIEAEISKSFDGWNLDSGCVGRVVEEFGLERVSYVLANTLRELDHDGRFSANNKEWSQESNIATDDNYNYRFVVTSHPAVLDGFISQLRREYPQLEQTMAGQAMPT